ncbi:potassium channel family protein [Puniceicoccus vermicola]|uniref:NAD-binding protein n=1 Tax=Puniceicoccus vermicola TaxID=388746 RepID=A0A7X1B2T8_9BACT|nr:ion channel [Puniceicoccus vermicola]MBC2603375.1 NAD-binding protein [Puniceicoccus vermicola]
MLLLIINKFFPPSSSLRRLAFVLFWTFCLNFVFGAAFYFAERNVQEGLSLADSIWWSMVTMTTVGYGDFYAQTSFGRFLVSYPTFLLGIGLLGYFLGSVADAVIKGASARRRGLVTIMKHNHFLICGHPSTSKVLQIIRELRVLDAYRGASFVLVANSIEELPGELASEGVLFVRGRPQSEDILRKAGVEKCDGVFVLAENRDSEDADAQTFATSAIIESISRECGRDIRVVSELIGRQNMRMMQRAGGDGIVAHEGITDCLLVQEFLSPGMNEIFHQIITNRIGSQFHILKTRLVGKKVRDIQVAAIKHPNSMQIIGLIQNGNFILNPSNRHVIGVNERLIILAEKAANFEDVENSILANDPPSS